MKHYPSISSFLAVCSAVALFAVANGASAGTSEDPGAPSANATRAQQGGTQDRVFGLSTNILQIPAAAFTARGTSTITTTYSSTGYIYSPTGGMLWAPVQLPAGAAVDWVDLHFYDNNTSDMTYWLTGYNGTTTPGVTDFVSGNTSGFTGYGYNYTAVSPAITINNDVAYGGGYQYVVNVSMPAGADYRIKGADIWWRRQISPAPGTATFGDVSTGHWAFQSIEALAASGITGGCGGGNFCPTTPVTRDQMAVFLAKALGLHYDR